MEDEIGKIKKTILEIAEKRLEEDKGCQGGFNAKVHSVIMDIQNEMITAMGGR